MAEDARIIGHLTGDAEQYRRGLYKAYVVTMHGMNAAVLDYTDWLIAVEDDL